ncbi:hypothetical protein G6F57_020199 [Rhizopus arrhizus]|nr:hypothetical protein G6F57_020199 [Rhizopus arrhizus]
MHQQAAQGRQGPVVVPPADAGHQDQAKAGDQQARRGVRPGHHGHARRNQQADDDGDTTAARRRHAMTAAFAGLVHQLLPHGIATGCPGQGCAQQGQPQQRPHHEPRHGSEHRVVQPRLDRPPLLAARALPVMRPRSETAAGWPWSRRLRPESGRSVRTRHAPTDDP